MYMSMDLSASTVVEVATANWCYVQATCLASLHLVNARFWAEMAAASEYSSIQTFATFGTAPHTQSTRTTVGHLILL